jgi:penicillin-insensitive murein endopeptidase
MMKRVILAACMLAAPALADTPAKLLFSAIDGPSNQREAPIGSYARGCLAGAVQLPETGPTWQAMRLSRNRHWGAPELVSFVERLGAASTQLGWNGINVGDMSQPRGGPMNGGHRSHQIGLDVDIWFTNPPGQMGLSARQRERVSAVNLRSSDQRSVNGNWRPEHMALLRAAAKDPAVARIFVAGAIKMQMCADAPRGDRRWLRKIRPWWGHNDHFHVRLNCPRGARSCENQAAIPRGDGCADAEWWVTDALAPPPPPDPNAPPPTPRAEITLATLPSQCTGVLQAE